MNKYYNSEGEKIQEAFDGRLKQIHDEIEAGEIGDVAGLLRVRGKLYRLKREYEKCGSRYLECEAEIIALNEIINETRRTERNV